MDFVVVSRRGVSVIEVKNWSSFYYKNHYGIPPHETSRQSGAEYCGLHSNHRGLAQKILQ